ncbi:unnamed protein product [Cuscuta campestris]|uniref:Uncharacterized protein n=1 Tax=Cuscuta campestris TaxID=132261 RepID=A0A484LKG0_9ASTE|nr:unnamed protein product [Cuscuta campestris]
MSSLSFTATVFILCRLRSHLCGCRLCRGHHSSLRAYTSLLRSDSPSIRFVSIRFVYLDQLRGLIFHLLLFAVRDLRLSIWTVAVEMLNVNRRRPSNQRYNPFGGCDLLLSLLHHCFVHSLLFGCCIALLLLALINWCCWSI